MAEPATTQHPQAAPPARPARRWLKAAAWSCAGVAAALISATAALWWWSGSEGSLATALRWAGQSQPLTFERAMGSLRSGGHVARLRWQQDGITVEARDVSLAWQAWALLQGTLKLDRVAIASVEVTDERPPAPTPTAPPNALGLPLRIALGEFSVGEFRYAGRTTVAASDLKGSYLYTGLQHQLELKSAQISTGRYSGRAVLSATGPLTLESAVSGSVALDVPNNPVPVPLNFQAMANGPLTELQLKAELRGTGGTQASVVARVMPWAAQPLPEANATFQELDIATLVPQAPQTLLNGSASVRPLAGSPQAWDVQLQLANALAGPWDQQRLPFQTLQTQGEWRDGTALIRSLRAELAGGELLATGEWTKATSSGPVPGTESAVQGWTLDATLRGVNAARLHTQLAALLMNGKVTVSGQGPNMRFDASVQALSGANGTARRPAARTHSGRNDLLGKLRLRDASASGNWAPRQAGGTLTLSTLQVRTDDAELKGQVEVRPAEKGIQGTLGLTAPGLTGRFAGSLQPASGDGELRLQASDAARALRWLQKLPGMPATVLGATASGNAGLEARWQGGWKNPAVQATLEAPLLDWTAAPTQPVNQAKTVPSVPVAPIASTIKSPSLLKLRGLKATLSGRLNQAELAAQGRLDIDQRRYTLELAADGGRMSTPGPAGTALAEQPWQAVVRQLGVGIEDPALGAGAWRLATRGPVPLKWTPTRQGSMFEAGTGQASLTAPPSAASSQAQLTWQPVRWRPGALVTAGKISGLPIAWIELLAGPQMKGAGLGGNLVFDGQWDAVLGDTLQLKASLARSSGDITVQAEGVQGNSARVAAGIKQVRISLETAGDALTLALVWDSERAGTVNGQLRTRLVRATEGQGTVGGWRWPDEAPISGQLNAQLPRIGVWSLLAPPGWRLRGSLGAAVAISGTRAVPSLSGDLQANDLALRSVVDGIEFANGRLRARLDGTRMRIDEFTLQGAGEKGSGGSLTAQGEAGWIEGKPQVQLDARLQQLRASIRTDRQLTVSGNVQASLKGNQVELTGKLLIDQARILLPDEGTPQLGDDVVVRTASGAAAGQKAPEKTSAQSTDKPARPLKLAVEIDLGRDFQIQGKGIDTQIRGILALTGTSLTDPQLQGTVSTVGGQYRAYGQRLEIEQGLIRFTGPIDNPALDILAIRPNLTQRVGVQITGTALLPSVRLYAQPELPDAEKLSWLVVGRASAAGGAESALLQQAALALLGSKSGGMSGGLAASLGLDELSFRGASSNADGTASSGAITLGKRFSRNFYAAYERSISGALGTLFVFYDLSQRFTIRAQAGQQSAVDLIFTIPYD